MNNILEKKHSLILVHGNLKPVLFDQLKKEGVKEAVIMEGRPSLKAAEHNAKELIKRKIKPILISDNMAGFLFFKELLKQVFCSYQFADKNGAVCEVGALILAILAKKHQVPISFFPSAKQTKFLGSPQELIHFKKKRIAPKGLNAYVPLVEWVDRQYITSKVMNRYS